MKPDRNKINIEMAKKKWNVPQLAKAYGVSGARMNIILNSKNLTSVCHKDDIHNLEKLPEIFNHLYSRF